MKNLFRGEIGQNQFLAEQFVERKVSEELAEEADALVSKLEKHDENSKLPPVLGTIKTIAFYAGLVILVGIINGLQERKEENLPLFDKTSIIFIIVCILSFAVSIGLFIYQKKRFKNVETSEELKDDVKEADDIYQRCLNDLNIPNDHLKVDVVMSFYKLKNGREVPAFNICENMVAEYLFFEQDNKLCFADTRAVICLPKDSVVKITKVEEKLSFLNWTKEELPNNEKYKEYNIKTNSYGINSVKYYYVIHLNLNDEEYFIVIPPYEIDQYLKVIPQEISE